MVFAWQTKQQVYFNVRDSKGKISAPYKAPGVEKFRHWPSVTVNKNGLILFSWISKRKWKHQKGNFSWQIFNKKGVPVLNKIGQKRAGTPANSRIEALALPDGTFLIIH